ncbi:MAG: Helix-turn-helix domain [Acidimicrobiaceae bacterium]|nr:Helix-turn-helix domain [Acidimicrobiaceae bacterium]
MNLATTKLVRALPATVAGATRLVAFLLAGYANNDGVAWPGKAKIAEETALSEPSVKRALRALIEMGVIEVVQRGGSRAAGGNFSNRYRFRGVVDDPPSVGPPTHQRESPGPPTATATSGNDVDPSDTSDRQVRQPAAHDDGKRVQLRHTALELLTIAANGPPGGRGDGSTIEIQRSADASEARSTAPILRVIQGEPATGPPSTWGVTHDPPGGVTGDP